MIALSRAMGITGVALAADLMILTGTLLLFRQARRIVSFSSRRLALWPAVALVVTAGVVLLLNPLWASLSPWGALLGKGGLIAGLFWGSLWLTEREQLCLGWKMVWDLLRPRLEAT